MDTMMNEPNDPSPEARMLEIRRLLRKPNSEDERFLNSQLLRQADAWLSKYVVNERGSEKILLLHIKVMRALKDMERVIESVRSKK